MLRPSAPYPCAPAALRPITATGTALKSSATDVMNMAMSPTVALVTPKVNFTTLSNCLVSLQVQRQLSRSPMSRRFRCLASSSRIGNVKGDPKKSKLRLSWQPRHRRRTLGMPVRATSAANAKAGAPEGVDDTLNQALHVLDNISGVFSDLDAQIAKVDDRERHVETALAKVRKERARLECLQSQRDIIAQIEVLRRSVKRSAEEPEDAPEPKKTSEAECDYPVLQEFEPLMPKMPLRPVEDPLPPPKVRSKKTCPAPTSPKPRTKSSEPTMTKLACSDQERQPSVGSDEEMCLPSQRRREHTPQPSSNVTRIVTVMTANAFAILEDLDSDSSERSPNLLDGEEEMDE